MNHSQRLRKGWSLLPASAKARVYTGKYLRPLNKFLGTANDNVQDMMTKGRYLSPVQAGHIKKITPKQKEEILNLKGKLPCTKVGPMYGVSYSNIAYIWRKYATC